MCTVLRSGVCTGACRCMYRGPWIALFSLLFFPSFFSLIPLFPPFQKTFHSSKPAFCSSRGPLQRAFVSEFNSEINSAKDSSVQFLRLHFWIIQFIAKFPVAQGCRATRGGLYISIKMYLALRLSAAADLPHRQNCCSKPAAADSPNWRSFGFKLVNNLNICFLFASWCNISLTWWAQPAVGPQHKTPAAAGWWWCMYGGSLAVSGLAVRLELIN